jgi:hypothetical protein
MKLIFSVISQFEYKIKDFGGLYNSEYYNSASKTNKLKNDIR